MCCRKGLLASFTFSIAAFGQHLVVTAEGHHGTAPPLVARDEVSVEVNRRPAAVRDWVPLRGDQASLELFVVIDDGTDQDLGNQFGSLRTFLNGQPGSTRIGLAYLRNGGATVVVPLTADHAQVAKALRIPLGQPGVAASPYMGVSELIKKWPAANARREVLLISSGIDTWSPADPQNIYLQKAIADAQRGGVLVHSIYYAEGGHRGHSYWQVNWGQNYLSQLGDETGGEAYWQGFNSPVSLDPFLKDLAVRLQNQYLLTVAAENLHGDLEPVKVNSSKAGVSLVAASKIHVAK
jgi:hypothetical protein